jgi:hypothetical protein
MNSTSTIFIETACVTGISPLGVAMAEYAGYRADLTMHSSAHYSGLLIFRAVFSVTWRYNIVVFTLW